MGGSGTSGVLCRYHLHGACKFGSACTFSHSLDDGESQVCRFYLRGECGYGDRCRYQHTKPEWRRQEGDGGGVAGGYAAPAPPRPAADDLAEQLPISRLRLGGQAPDAGAAGARQLALPLRLPADPFGSGAGGEAAEEERRGEGVDEAWLQEEAAWGEEGGEYWQEGDGEGWGQEGAWEEGDGEFGGGEEAWRGRQAGEEAGGEQPGAWSLPGGDTAAGQWTGGGHPALRSLCMQWFSSGACARGERCTLVHGQLCQHCHKHALHPADAAAREQHLAECRLRHERLAARARSAAVECSVCLEPVLGKGLPGERKFGLLTGCDHPFCLGCIRSWRQKTDGGADVDTALRTCPVCRTTSHYIVPSLTWPTSVEEKERIVAGYRAKLSTVDCRYFAFGDGTCPFSTSCFYRHAYPDGRLEDASLRKAADEEGTVRVMQPVRLSDFISISNAGRRVLGGGGRRSR